MIAKMAKYDFVLYAAQSEDFIEKLRELGQMCIRDRYHAGEIEYLAARGASQVHQYQCLPFMDAYPSASAAFQPRLVDDLVDGELGRGEQLLGFGQPVLLDDVGRGLVQEDVYKRQGRGDRQEGP